ncbi:hypothetical protein CHS0354_013589 [Potamilus streckersoni]|uniref:Laccase n=1 Tax=Potamilus streckersoni TaxID=2493646 RepID=A0AAE0SLN6_9BIVA|nr:hypothetical protein CHS0354_013589 [Potamilus streckersoni]
MKTVVLILFATHLAGGVMMPKLSDYRNHTCYRTCTPTITPLTCEYDFRLENYQTLSIACFDCPRNISDCFRPYCIAADGVLRSIQVVNRMLPGPAIHICEGDTVVVNVYNSLLNNEGTAIHWHGILHPNTPFMDGVSMMTQCAISSKTSFQYRFKPPDHGTYYWHAHSGLQQADGVFGSFVVRPKSSVVQELYDYDLAEHTVIINEWFHETSISKFTAHHHAMQDNSPKSILINGKGAWEDKQIDNQSMMDHDTGQVMTTTLRSQSVTSASVISTTKRISTTPMPMDHNQHGSKGGNMDMTNMSTSAISFTSRAVFSVKRGMRYRFRLIGNGVVNCPLQVSIDNHTLMVIASDGVDIEPFVTKAIDIYAGERYDIVVQAFQPIGNYWIRVFGMSDCKTANQTAILHYDTAPMELPREDPNGFGILQDNVLNSINITGSNKSITVAAMKPFKPHTKDILDEIKRAPDHKFFIAVDFNKVNNYNYLDKDYYPLSLMLNGGHGNTHLMAMQMNHITFIFPDAPPLTQYKDVPETIFCNESLVPADCKTEFCECTHRLKVKVGDLVEMIVIGEAVNGEGNHPMHLHGHQFWILGMKKLKASITREEVEALDAHGGIERNYDTAITKDTVLVPDGGYTIIKFVAKHPGFWLFHCHVGFHLAMGLGMVIQVGEIHEMTQPPPSFPRCGSWRTDTSNDQSRCYSQTQTSSASTFFFVATLYYYVFLCPVFMLFTILL